MREPLSSQLLADLSQCCPLRSQQDLAVDLELDPTSDLDILDKKVIDLHCMLNEVPYKPDLTHGADFGSTGADDRKENTVPPGPLSRMLLG